MIRTATPRTTWPELVWELRFGCCSSSSKTENGLEGHWLLFPISDAAQSVASSCLLGCWVLVLVLGLEGPGARSPLPAPHLVPAQSATSDPVRAKRPRFAAPCVPVPPRTFLYISAVLAYLYILKCMPSRGGARRAICKGELFYVLKDFRGKRGNTRAPGLIPHILQLRRGRDLTGGAPESTTKMTTKMSLTLIATLSFLIMNERPRPLGRYAALGDLGSS
jgi:hypothetical protein